MSSTFLTSKYLLITLWILAIALRTQNFFIPPVDAHAMRQTDTESVAYYFATKDPNILHPQASLIRPQTNIHGYFFLEFPSYQYLLSIFYRIFGPSYLVARIVNLFLFSLSYWLVYSVFSQLFSKKIGIWSAIIFSLIPTSIFFFGHAIHPDLYAITTVLGALYIQTRTKRNIFLTCLAGLLFALAVGTRPFILMALPSLIIATYFKKGRWWEYPIIILSSVSVYGFWSWWQDFYPEADNKWQYWILLGKEALYTFAGWKHLVWRNVSGEVIGRIASTLAGVGVLVLIVQFVQYTLQAKNISATIRQFLTALFKKPETVAVDFKIFAFTFPWIAAIPVYWYIAPAGNAIHQYYANVFVLPIVIIAAYGVNALTSFTIFRKNKSHYQLLSVIIILALLYNGYRTSSYFYQNIVAQHNLEIAKIIEEKVPVGEKVVYLAADNSVPFSVAHRQGWMLGEWPTDVGANSEAILNMRQYGAYYYVYAKQNTDLPTEELEKLRKETQLFYTSEQVDILKAIPEVK